MTKLGNIEFDDGIIDALRDNRLVIFAGAGVSMGAPSNLSSFWKLTYDIATGTGQEPSLPLDRFLGQLNHNNVNVHERAAQLLSPENSSPNELHFDILRLFKTLDSVRLVTTNFDLHFETAANEVFTSSPEIYNAPALPLGYNFSGIVHLHGALPRAQDLVLTDSDFGRAYLTEGWARRFLVDLFRSYTVLFVGYSHDDVVMNYLARALPADSVAGRFALTDEDGNWPLLDIKPIHFAKNDSENPYQQLYDGIQLLSERTTRGVLDWQSRLTELGNRLPPTDEEAIGEIEQALKEVHTTRFLLDVARDPEWVKWLNGRHHLDSLFSTQDLNEKDMLLVGWLSVHFALEHPDYIFQLISAHKMQMNHSLWSSICREIGLAKEKQLEDSTLKRWASILLSTKPVQANHHCLMWLAARCAAHEAHELTLKVFMSMTKHTLQLRPGFVWPDDDREHPKLDVECQLSADHYTLDEVWTKHLKPHLNSISQPLLSSVTQQIEEMHHELVAWGKASREWDPISYGRSAIEPHEQDQFAEAIDVLIDATRDALEWLSGTSIDLLDAWKERLINSDAPLLRRIAIHSITAHTINSPETCLQWLLDRIDLDSLPEHHEVFRAVAQFYAKAGGEARQSVVDKVLTYSRSAHNDSSSEMRTARLHFDWLSWLLQHKPDCELAAKALEPISILYPDWQLSDHPDLTHWVGSADWVSSESPWSVEQLIGRTPRESINDLLNFSEEQFGEPNRDGLLACIREACKQEIEWAFALTQALNECAQWSSDIWPALFQGLKESELNSDGWHNLLTIIANNPELQQIHTYDIARLLYSIVKDGGKVFALDLIEQANSIALSVWQAAEPYDREDNIDNWLNLAINHPGGILVEFWLNGLSLLLKEKTGTERVMPENYRNWFTLALQNETSKAGMARSLLASQTAFLFSLDKNWVRQYIIPLFSDPDQQKFSQAWDGFLVWGRLNPELTDELLPAFVDAVSRLAADNRNRRRQFMQLYTSLAAFHVTDPMQDLLPALFRNGSLDDRLIFASQITYTLRQMEIPARRQLWESWLCRYWKARQQGVLAKLDAAEIQKMLEWLPHLNDAFPEAVAIATESPIIHIDHSHVLYELRNSDLVTIYAQETAELLIYLANCLANYHGSDLANIDSRLPEIPEELRRRLNEAFARAGIRRNGN